MRAIDLQQPLRGRNGCLGVVLITQDQLGQRTAAVAQPLALCA